MTQCKESSDFAYILILRKSRRVRASSAMRLKANSARIMRWNKRVKLRFALPRLVSCGVSRIYLMSVSYFLNYSAVEIKCKQASP